MTAIATRSSVLGVKPESVEGTPVLPTSALDFTALQDDFEMSPETEKLENAELRASIAPSKSILGLEAPVSSFSHYMRASGVEGVAPDFNEIPKAFFGAEVTEGTERVTTTAVNNVEDFTLPSFAAATSADFAVFYDTNGAAWAFSLDKTGVAAEPTATAWTAVAAGKKDHVDISGATTAAQVAALIETALNALSGFTALFTTDDTAANGELLITSDFAAPTTDSVVSNANGSGAGSITVVTSVSGVASSTASVIRSPSASVNMQRGYGMLIKDSVNGYRVRVVHAVSGVDITPSFNVPTAPADGTSLGKPVFWKPANDSHQTLTLWHYLGNGGAVQMIAGARVTALTIEAAAGQLINSNFGFEAIAFYTNPIEITSSTRYIDWTDDAGTFAAAIAVGWYKDPHAVAEALTSAMNTADDTHTKVVVYLDSNGKFKITAPTSGVLSLLWQSGANTANTVGTKIGFSVGANDTGAGGTTGYTSDNAYTLTAPYTPTYDSADPVAAKNQEVMFGDQDDYVCFNVSEISFNGQNTRRPIESICAESGQSGSIISERVGTITLKALLDQYDVDKYRKYRANDEVRFQFTFGVKSGGNWVPGKVMYFYAPTATISSYNVTDDDGLASLEMELSLFANSTGEGEMYLGQN